MSTEQEPQTLEGLVEDALSFHQYHTAGQRTWAVSQNYQDCSCDWQTRTMVEQLAHLAEQVRDRLLALPVTERAALLGIELAEEPADLGTAEITAYIVTDDDAEAERFADAVADAAMAFDNAGAVGRLGVVKEPRLRYVTPWISS